MGKLGHNRCAFRAAKPAALLCACSLAALVATSPTMPKATASGVSARATWVSGRCVVTKLVVSCSDAKHITLEAARSRACNHSVWPRNPLACGAPDPAITALLTGPVTRA